MYAESLYTGVYFLFSNLISFSSIACAEQVITFSYANMGLILITFLIIVHNGNCMEGNLVTSYAAQGHSRCFGKGQPCFKMRLHTCGKKWFVHDSVAISMLGSSESDKDYAVHRNYCFLGRDLFSLCLENFAYVPKGKLLNL